MKKAHVMKTMGVRLQDEVLEHVISLSEELDVPRGYVIRRFLEVAVKLHKLGVIEFPELTINFEALEKLKGESKG